MTNTDFNDECLSTNDERNPWVKRMTNDEILMTKE